MPETVKEKMLDYILIQNDHDLATTCDQLGRSREIAVDLEADSMHHFREKVCLIQLADSQGPVLADPLALTDMTPLKQLFENPAITKVFHGADFDVRSLDRDFSICVKNLFDTEIACRFLGIQKRSLAALLQKYFDLTVDKRFQKVDWSRRPLSDDMIVYSMNDVAYLVELKDILEKRLLESGRLHWAREEFDLQANVRHEPNDHEPLFLKFKGAGRMSRRSLAVLEHLLQMRQTISKAKDRPLFKVISAEAITRMAGTRPASMNQLKQARVLSTRQMSMYGEDCVQAITQGMELPEKDLPVYPKKRKPAIDPEVPGIIKALKQLREQASERLGIEPGFLINNTSIAALAIARPCSIEEMSAIESLRQWQIEALGKDLVETLQRFRRA